MKKYNYEGFNRKSLSTLFLLLLLFVFSCEQKEDQVSPKPNQDSALEKHLKFLEETTGTDRKDIDYDEDREVFYVGNDLFISKKAVEDHIDKKTNASKSNQRTEQRRYTYLVSDAYVTNIKYYVQPSVPAEWRGPITSAINEWNNIGGTKVRMSEVGNSAEANINVDVLFDDVNNWVARAELPYSDGQPGRVLTVNSFHNGMESGQKLFAMVHEMGHNIGFLHTNQTDGEIIPGTPETDPNSVMNSFVLPWNGFTEYDRIATRNLYPAGSGVVTVYKDCGFAGPAIGLEVGDYNLGALIGRGIQNDDLSSVRVAAGYEVVLYEHDNFEGASQIYSGDDDCLVDNGINDWVSSVRVRQSSSSFSQIIQAESYGAMSGVQLEGTGDEGGGENVGWIESNDWMAYMNINIPSSGSYRVEYRVASPNGTGKLSLDVNAGATVLGTVDIPNTGGWQNWVTVSHTVNINAGTYNFGIFASTGGWNINWWRITKL